MVRLQRGGLRAHSIRPPGGQSQPADPALPLLFLQTWFPLSSYPVTKEGAKNSNPKGLHGLSPRGPTPRSPKPCQCSQQGRHPLPSGLPPFCLFPWLCPSDCCSWSPQWPPPPPPPCPPSSPLRSLWECLGVEGKPVRPLPWQGHVTVYKRHPRLTWTLPTATGEQSQFTIIGEE